MSMHASGTMTEHALVLVATDTLCRSDALLHESACLPNHAQACMDKAVHSVNVDVRTMTHTYRRRRGVL